MTTGQETPAATSEGAGTVIEKAARRAAVKLASDAFRQSAAGSGTAKCSSETLRSIKSPRYPSSARRAESARTLAKK